MNIEKLREVWKKEENATHIHEWVFSHIRGRYEVERDLPWNYESIVRHYLSKDTELLDYDTGGGENDRDLVEMVLPGTKNLIYI